METPVFCGDCVHCIRDDENRYTEPQCDCVECRGMVTAWPVRTKFARSAAGNCKQEGKHFKAKKELLA